MFLRARVKIRFVRYFWLLEVCRTVRGVSANSLLRADGQLFEVQYWKFGWHFRTNHPVLADGLPCPRGQSAPSTRTVRRRLCRLPKSFGS
jgi:hypothetical protein